MKYRFLALLICMSAFTVADAQEKHWEHNIYIEFGGAKSFSDGEDPYAFHIGYGLNYYIDKHWSVMPGISYRAKFKWGDTDDGASDYDCSYIDIPIVGQYHLNFFRHSGVVFEVGPVFSFRASGNEYYNDLGTYEPWDSKQIYKSFDVGIQPAVYYQAGRHWRIGVKGHIGLINQCKKYQGINESYHADDITASLEFCF